MIVAAGDPPPARPVAPGIPSAGPDATDRALLARALGDKLDRMTASRGAAGAAEIRRWIEMLHAEDAACGLAVAERLEQLLRHVDGDGLSRWILSGLRLYEREPQRQRAYFRLEDPRAVEFLHGEAGAQDLARAAPSLGLLLRGLSGRDLSVQACSQSVLNAPAQRPIVTGSHLLLPDSYTLLDGPDRYRIYRAAVAHAVAHLRHSPLRQPVKTLKPMGVAVVSAVEDARVERLLVQEFPGVRRWFLEFLTQEADRADLGFAALVARMGRALMDEAYEDGNYWVEKARTLFEAQARSEGLGDHDAFRRIASVLANDLGQMRVRFNPQQYAVPVVYRDDNSVLWDYGDADTPPPQTQELFVRGVALEHRPREGDGGGVEVAPAPAEELGRFSYPEWDHRSQQARTDWVTVIERLPSWPVSGLRAQAQPDAAALPPLALPRARRLSRVRRLRRQHEGDDIDLNAAIEVLVDRRLDLAPEARVFMRPGHEEQVAAIVILLDLSESANDRVGGSMRSILDVEKQATLMLLQAAAAGRDRIAVHGFKSDTRNEVHYLRLLDFDDPRDDAALGRIRSAQAAHSTRMGAAIRHAAAHLKSDRLSDRRAVIVLTDGAPSDVDVFDPDYLIEDAGAAVHEAARQGVECYGVTLDPSADAYARRIFGSRNYRLVDAPEALPAHLSGLYARLAAR